MSGDLADVADRLGAALRESLDDQPANVALLASRTRAAIARDRLRRRWWQAGIGAVVVPAAVFGGLTGPFAAAPGGGGPRLSAPEPVPTVPPSPLDEPSVAPPTATPSRSATDLPPTATSSRSAGTPTRRQTTPVARPDEGPDPARFEIVPWAVAAKDLDRNKVAYRIPASVNLTTKEVTGPAQRGKQLGDYAGFPVVPGQTCAPGTVLPRPVAGKNFVWNQEEFVVEVHVAGWAPGTVESRFAEIRRNAGRCSFGDVTLTPLGLEGMGAGDEEYAAVLETDAMPGTAFAVGRVGEVTVAVTVRSYVPPDDPALQREGAGAQARQFLQVVTERVRTSGLVRTAATGGSTI